MSLYFISFFAGAVSFLSPCVLPLVPGYISFICGTTLEGLEEQNKSFILKNTLLFAIGFSIVFISLGATATFFGNLLFNYSKIFTVIVGVIIILIQTTFVIIDLITYIYIYEK